MIDPMDANVTEPAPAPEPESSGANKVLSPEEQMERFEEDLKENDWGHQPC